jgi:hypothetical protein
MRKSRRLTSPIFTGVPELRSGEARKRAACARRRRQGRIYEPHRLASTPFCNFVSGRWKAGNRRSATHPRNCHEGNRLPDLVEPGSEPGVGRRRRRGAIYEPFPRSSTVDCDFISTSWRIAGKSGVYGRRSAGGCRATICKCGAREGRIERVGRRPGRGARVGDRRISGQILIRRSAPRMIRRPERPQRARIGDAKANRRPGSAMVRRSGYIRASPGLPARCCRCAVSPGRRSRRSPPSAHLSSPAGGGCAAWSSSPAQ